MSKGVTVSAPYFFQCALRAQLTHDCGPYLQLCLFNTGRCGTLCAIVALCGASCAKTYVCDVTVY